MHVALLTNLAWLDEELAGFNRLIVGLIDEGVRVAQVVPEAFPADEISVFGERVVWRESAWNWLSRRRLHRVVEPLRQLNVDLLHVLGGPLWDPAVRIALAMDIPVVLNVGTYNDLQRLERAWRYTRDERIAMAGLTEPLAEAVRNRVSPKTVVEMIPSGVHLPNTSHACRDASQPLCAVVSGNGLFDEQYETMLAAIRTIVDEHPQALFFFHSQNQDRHKLWQEIRRLDLTGSVSLMPPRLNRPELLLRADVLLHPQALGRSRSIMLEAMARGLPVIAKADPWLDYLVDGETAWVVEGDRPVPWVERLRELIDDPGAGKELGERARRRIADRHVAAEVVARTLRLYRTVTGESIRFPEPTAA